MKTKHFIIAFFTLVLAVINANANNMLVQNVTTLNDNPTAKTVQVQFDLSWDNSWRDSINWDAAWIFLKFKDANGLWQHAKLNTNGFQNGSGTSNTLKVTSDNVGAWVYRDTRGSGTFNSTTMQLQWNYGMSGLTKVTGLEVRVFAVEMVYVPEGDFNCAKTFNTNTYTSNSFNAPGNNFPVINSKLTPSLTYNDGTTATFRIKGDAGIDTDNNGVIDNTTYPNGYRAFYCYKYELTEQQFADFFNTLTTTQITNLGFATNGIKLNNGQYFSSTPNKAYVNNKSDTINSNTKRFLAFADWSGVRPMSFLEFNKASYGPLQPIYNQSFGYNCCNHGYVAWGTSNTGPVNFASTATTVGYAAGATSSRAYAGASYFGILELTGSATEPVVKMNYTSFNTTNGNGFLLSTGISDISNWTTTGMIIFIDNHNVSSVSYRPTNYGFRYVRSAE